MYDRTEVQPHIFLPTALYTETWSYPSIHRKLCHLKAFRTLRPHIGSRNLVRTKQDLLYKDMLRAQVWEADVYTRNPWCRQGPREHGEERSRRSAGLRSVAVSF